MVDSTVIRLYLAVLLFFFMNASASSGQTTTQIPITASVRPSLCVINNNLPLTFNFGLMSILKINGINYSKSNTFPVVCDYYVNKPIVSVSGKKLSNATPNVLATNIDGLGIALYQGSSVDSASRLNISTEQTISKGLIGMNSSNGSLTITAVPYTTVSNDCLRTGDFQANASISIYYQ